MELAEKDRAWIAASLEFVRSMYERELESELLKSSRRMLLEHWTEQIASVQVKLAAQWPDMATRGQQILAIRNDIQPTLWEIKK